MPYSKMTDEQLEAVIDALETFQDVPGVTMYDVKFVDTQARQPGVVVYVDPRDRTGIARLPTSIAGVPVLLVVEDPRTCTIIRTVDPRTSGGSWPASLLTDP